MIYFLEKLNFATTSKIFSQFWSKNASLFQCEFYSDLCSFYFIEIHFISVSYFMHERKIQMLRCVCIYKDLLAALAARKNGWG